MQSKLIANWKVRHSGKRYGPGDEIAGITPAQARPLVEIGAASWSAVLPADDEPVGGAEVQQETERDFEEESKQYHVGFGRYEIPGIGEVRGKEAAIEALRSQENDS